MIKKRCSKCGGNKTKQYGIQNGKQQYFCNICKKKFELKNWSKSIEEQQIIGEYTKGKQAQEQIGKKLGRSREWVIWTIKNNSALYLCAIRQQKEILLLKQYETSQELCKM